jgi:hypothetical protein
MKYRVEFQQLHKGDVRPTDDGESISAHALNPGDVALLPNVGDYVSCGPSSTRSTDEYTAPRGRVKSKLFHYWGDEMCSINIVIEDIPNDDWGALSKS